MPPVFDDFFVDFCGDFSHGVVSGAVEFVGFGGSGVIMTHYFEGLANVDGLRAV